MIFLPTRLGPKQPSSTVASDTRHLQTKPTKIIATRTRFSSQPKSAQDTSFSIAYASTDLKIIYRVVWSNYLSFIEWKTEVLTWLQLPNHPSCSAAELSLKLVTWNSRSYTSLFNRGHQQVLYGMCVSRYWSYFCFVLLNKENQCLSLAASGAALHCCLGVFPGRFFHHYFWMRVSLQLGRKEREKEKWMNWNKPLLHDRLVASRLASNKSSLFLPLWQLNQRRIPGLILSRV